MTCQYGWYSGWFSGWWFDCVCKYVLPSGHVWLTHPCICSEYQQHAFILLVVYHRILNDFVTYGMGRGMPVHTSSKHLKGQLGPPVSNEKCLFVTFCLFPLCPPPGQLGSSTELSALLAISRLLPSELDTSKEPSSHVCTSYGLTSKSREGLLSLESDRRPDDRLRDRRRPFLISLTWAYKGF